MRPSFLLILPFLSTGDLEYEHSRLSTDLRTLVTAAPLLSRSFDSGAAVAPLTLLKFYSRLCTVLFSLSPPSLSGVSQELRCKCGGGRKVKVVRTRG